MVEIIIRDMQPEDEYFVSTCTHVNESAEIDACAEGRRSYRGTGVRACLLTSRSAFCVLQ